MFSDRQKPFDAKSLFHRSVPNSKSRLYILRFSNTCSSGVVFKAFLMVALGGNPVDVSLLDKVLKEGGAPPSVFFVDVGGAVVAKQFLDFVACT